MKGTTTQRELKQGWETKGRDKGGSCTMRAIRRTTAKGTSRLILGDRRERSAYRAIARFSTRLAVELLEPTRPLLAFLVLRRVRTFDGRGGRAFERAVRLVIEAVGAGGNEALEHRPKEANGETWHAREISDELKEKAGRERLEKEQRTGRTYTDRLEACLRDRRSHGIGRLVEGRLERRDRLPAWIWWWTCD
jgi:hypothetical protein